jgi:hypothetical protein
MNSGADGTGTTNLLQNGRLSSLQAMTAGYWKGEGLRYYSPALQVPDRARA